MLSPPFVPIPIWPGEVHWLEYVLDSDTGSAYQLRACARMSPGRSNAEPNLHCQRVGKREGAGNGDVTGRAHEASGAETFPLDLFGARRVEAFEASLERLRQHSNLRFFHHAKMISGYDVNSKAALGQEAPGQPSISV